MAENENQKQPPQHQGRQPGIESEMSPIPESVDLSRRPAGRLEGKVTLITGGDSGICRAVAVLFAREGSDVSIVYYDEHSDAEETCRMVEQEGRTCLRIPGDVADESFCQQAVVETVRKFGRLDILVNNAGVQFPKESIEQITEEQLDRTFRTNIYSQFFMTKAALGHLGSGSAIVNTTSVTAYRGNPGLLDYSSTKGAIVAFTRSLSLSLLPRGIRVNAVAPGPIWTPLIPATFTEDHVARFGGNVPMDRAGQPDEVAPCYLFLASVDSSYMSGQVLHPNGGEPVES